MVLQCSFYLVLFTIGHHQRVLDNFMACPLMWRYIISSNHFFTLILVNSWAWTSSLGIPWVWSLFNIYGKFLWASFFIYVSGFVSCAQVVHFKGSRKRLMLESWNFFISSSDISDMLCLILMSGRTKYDFWIGSFGWAWLLDCLLAIQLTEELVSDRSYWE